MHTGVFDDSMTFAELGGMSAGEFLRDHYNGTLIGNGSYTPEQAQTALEEGAFDLVAIGRPLIANADLVDKVRTGGALVPYDAEMLTELV